MTPEPNPGQQLDAIMDDLDATTKAWAAAGHRFEGPEHEAREAVFARLKAWNQERSERDARQSVCPCNYCGAYDPCGCDDRADQQSTGGY